MHTRHVFLTGEVQVGKSTLIKRLLAAHPGWCVKGFRTFTGQAAAPGEGRPVYIAPAQITDACCRADSVVGIRLEGGQLQRFPDAFDGPGVRLLRDSYGADFILMDELGSMESDAELFQQQVFRTLDGPIPVLGVLKLKETPFLNAVRSRPDVMVVHLTRENGDECFAQVNAHLCRVVKMK